MQERGHSQWSSRTRFSSVSTVAPISFSPLANNFSSTINNSRTNPNAVKLAKENEPRPWDCLRTVATTSGWRPRPSAPDASGRPPCRSSPRRDVRCFAVSASSSARRLLRQHNQLECFRRRERGDESRTHSIFRQVGGAQTGPSCRNHEGTPPRDLIYRDPSFLLLRSWLYRMQA